MKRKNKTLKIISFTILGVLAVVILFMASFFMSSYEPSTEAMANLKDSALVDVTEDNFITFTPQNKEATTGLIIYPGAKVEPESYAPLANKIAQAGYEVIITPMPLNFAIFDANAADEVISKFPNIKNWAIAGHSLGGVMAAKYASEHDNIDGGNHAQFGSYGEQSGDNPAEISADEQTNIAADASIKLLDSISK